VSRWPLWFARWPRTFLVALAVLTAGSAWLAAHHDVEFDLVRLYAETGGEEAAGPGRITVAADLPPGDPAWAVLATSLAARHDVADVFEPKFPDALEKLSPKARERVTRSAWGSDGAAVWTALSVDLAAGASSQEAVAAFRAEVADVLPAQTERVIVGVPVLNVAHAESAKQEQFRLLPMVFFVFLTLLLALFRSVWGAILPLLSVGASAVLVLGMVAALDVALGGPLLLLLPLVLVLGLADSIHLLQHVAVARQNHPPATALERALLDVGPACFLTSLTTASGFVALCFTHSPMLRTFGALGAMGMGIALTAGLGLPAALLALRPDASIEVRPWGSAPTLRLLNLLSKPKGTWPVLVQAGLVVVLLGVASGVRPDLRLGGELADGAQVLRDHAWVDEQLDGVFPLMIRVETGTEFGCSNVDAYASLARLHRRIEDHPVTGGVVSFVTPMEWVSLATGRSVDSLVDAGPGKARRYRTFYGKAGAVSDAALPMPLYDEDQSAFLIWARLHDTGARSWASLLDTLDVADEKLPGVDVETGGFAHLAVQAWRQLVPDLWRVLGFSSVAALLSLLIAFRSPRAAIWSILPLLLTVLVALSSMRLAGIPLAYPNLFVLAAAVGLGVDALIHLLAHYQRHQDVDLAIRVAGSSIVWTYGLLLAGLGTLALSRAQTVREVGGILVVAMCVNLISTLLTFRALGAVHRV
jgi:uncharacterized protein